MKVRFWGTRGSIPTPGAHTVRYGGNTPCVEVRLPNDELVIFDAGTGIRGLGDELLAAQKPIRAVLAITHPHWDHIQGFPFFKPLFIAGNEITIIGPKFGHIVLKQVISDVMNKTYFPVKLDELRASIKFTPLNEGSVSVFGATLSASFVNHPSLTVGYRIEANGQSLVYISDNEPFERELPESGGGLEDVVLDRFAKRSGDPNGHIYDFVRGADLLIHDTTYTPEEYAGHVGWGHSHYLFSLKVAEEGGVGKLALFHHDQTHDDEKVDEILADCRRIIKARGLRFECVAACEGMVIQW